MSQIFADNLGQNHLRLNRATYPNLKELKNMLFTVFENFKKSLIQNLRYVEIKSGKELSKNAKNGSFLRVFENLQLVVRQRYMSLLKRTKIG